MAYRIAGRYVAVCNCSWVCPCPVDQKPNTPDGECRGVAVFDIRDGNLDGTDLSGTRFALFNHFPSNISAGNWSVSVVVDDGASDEQASAIERILSGQEGGPFGEFAGLIGDYAGMERGRVSVSDGSASVGDKADYTWEPFTGPTGQPTTVSSAMFGFAPTYTIGRGSGRAEALGQSFEPKYGESADFEYSSEAVGEVHLRA